MRLTKRIPLIAAALIWLCSNGIAAAAYMDWSEQSYASLTSADSASTIPPGTKITSQNWQQYKDFMPVGMQGLWRGQFYWHLPDNAVMSVGATTPTPLF